jgi:outer membrane protein TolC
MGVVVVGGMILSTFLTLIVVPSLYITLSKLKRVPRKPRNDKATVSVGAIVVMLGLLAGSTSVSADTLTLQDAISTALRNNFDVQIARQDSLIAKNIGDTKITGFLPTLDVNGNYTDGANNLSQTLADGRVIERDGAGYSNLNANAALVWTLFDGLQMFAQADRATALENEGLARVRSRMAYLIADVITAYNAIVATQRFLVTADSALVLGEQRYTIEKYRYDVGSASGVELAQAEIDRNSQRALVIRTRTDLNNAKAALNTLLARDPSTSFDATADIVIPPMPSRDEIITSIDKTNPDVLAAEHAMAAASAHVREATSTFMPTIAAVGGYQFTRNTAEAGFLLENISNGWNVGLTFRWNLFNGLADQLERERRTIINERMRLDHQAIRNDLVGLADRTLRSYQAAGELLDIQRASYTAAERNARIALEKLRVGTITPLEVRQTFQTLLEVGENLARLEYDQRLAATEVLRIAGRLVNP